MSILKELIEKISKAEEMASRPLHTFPPEKLQMGQRRIREAKDSLVQLKKEYKSALLKNSMVISIDGSESHLLAGLLNKELGITAVNYTDIEKEFLEVSGLDPLTPFWNFEFQTILGAANRLKIKYGIIHNKGLNPDDSFLGKLTGVAIGQFLKTNYGETFHSTSAAQTITDIALELKFGGKKLGVALYNSNGVLDSAIFPEPSVKLTVNSKEEAQKALEDLLAKFAPQKTAKVKKEKNVEVKPKKKKR